MSATEALTPYLIILAISLLIISTVLRLERKNKNQRKPKYINPRGEDADEKMRTAWMKQVLAFLAKDTNRTTIFTGLDLVLNLEGTEEIRNLEPTEKEEWERFLRNKAGLKKGLPHYFINLALVNMGMIEKISESERGKGQRIEKELEDGYWYTYYTNKNKR